MTLQIAETETIKQIIDTINARMEPPIHTHSWTT